MSRSNQTGDRGEGLAVQYLQRKGYTIIETNWHCARGEIDIIAHDGDCRVFVEVRTRTGANTEAAFASVTPTKRQKLVDSVNLYLHEHQDGNVRWRIDLIAIALPRAGKPLIEHVEDALDW